MGEEDTDPGVAASVSLAARIPGAQFTALPATGHLSTLEQPEAVGAALQAFLEGLPAVDG